LVGNPFPLRFSLQLSSGNEIEPAGPVLLESAVRENARNAWPFNRSGTE
jgi:hypothetical protein